MGTNKGKGLGLDTFSFWTRLDEFIPDEDKRAGWVHALPVGVFHHPVHGTVNLTPDRIQRFADGVNSRVRGIDLYANYDHREKSGEAAGWIQSADVREDGLWLYVEWNEDAAAKIKGKKYKYWSTEYQDQWENPHSKQVFKDVIVGGALTNIPFLKNLVPVNLSELGTENDAKEHEVNEAILALLGLSKDATEDDVKKAITTLNEGKESAPTLDFSKMVFAQDGNIVKITHPDAEGEATFEISDVKRDDDEQALAELAEKNPAVARLLSEQKTQSDAIKRLEAANRLGEVVTRLSEVGGAKKTLPPAVSDRLRSVLVRLPKELSEEVCKAFDELGDKGFVELGEQGGKPVEGSGRSTEGGDPVETFLDLVDAVQKENEKVSFSEAVDIAAQKNPTEFKAYNEAFDSGVVTLLEQ